MGDRYAQRDYYDRYGNREYRDDRYDRDYRRYSGYERSRSPTRERYHPPERDRYDDYYADRNGARSMPRGGDFSFRGAAGRDSNRFARPEETFSFRAQGPTAQAPRFPPADRHPLPQRPRRIEDARRDHANQRARGGQNRQDARGRGRYRRGPAESREALHHAFGGSTPERLAGMGDDGDAPFKMLESSSDNESDENMENQSRGSEEQDGQARKRIKTSAPTAVESAAPKWSNPDAYTSLPVPDNLGGSKKDIVHLIRKAKIDSAAKLESENAVKSNADFISFDMDDDKEIGEVSDADSNNADMTIASAPDAPAAMTRLGDLRNGNTNGKVTRPLPPPNPLRKLDDPAPKDPKPKRKTPVVILDDSPEEFDNKSELDDPKPKGKKRKFEEQSKARGDLLPEWAPDDHADSTPWLKQPQVFTADTGLRLHKEICDFYEFVRPYPYEEDVRRDLVSRVQRSVRGSSINGAKNVDIRCFGSFAAGLYLPTADMDLVAVSPGYMKTGVKTFCQPAKKLYPLAAHLWNSGLAAPDSVSPVAKAKVPIVKFVDRLTGIKVDISFENNTGLKAIETFQAWKSKHPAMPVLVVMIKQMLAMRGLNEVFTGGLGGFSIICLVVSMLDHHPAIQSGDMDQSQHLGELLLHFLDLYGNRFDITRVGIIMEPAKYYDKVSSPKNCQNSKSLTIIDPNNPANDISGGSREINHVLDLFRDAHSALQRRLGQIRAGKDVEDTILGCIWGGNYATFMEQRENLSRIHRGEVGISRPSRPAPTHWPRPPVNSAPPKPSGASLRVAQRSRKSSAGASKGGNRSGRGRGRGRDRDRP